MWTKSSKAVAATLGFRIVLRELKTRAKLWESIQAVFKILPRENMAQVLLSVAEMYQIKRAQTKLSLKQPKSAPFAC